MSYLIELRGDGLALFIIGILLGFNSDFFISSTELFFENTPYFGFGNLKESYFKFLGISIVPIKERLLFIPTEIPFKVSYILFITIGCFSISSQVGLSKAFTFSIKEIANAKSSEY